jgi:hypothetical protein
MNMRNLGLPTLSSTSSASTKPTPISSLFLSPPEPPKFPTLEELVEQDRRISTPSVRRGLFQELLQGRPEEMYVDSLEHPEKYSDELRTLLTEMVSTRKRPSPEESLMLDAGVLDFMAKPKPKEVPKPPPAKKKVESMDFKSPDFAGADYFESPGPDPALSVGGGVKPFWWL